MSETDHWHCPLDCEHPQPFKSADNKWYCGRCAAIDKVMTEMVPCTPDICDEATE